LSFASNNNGNGYRMVTLNAFAGIGTGGTLLSTASQPMPTMGSAITTFSNIAGVNGNGMTTNFVTFQLVFSNGSSNGQDLQTVIDNIQLTAGVVIPEPATVWGGLLGVCALCWHQRRRLIGVLPLRRV
jgi:hypothetical protein